MANNKKNSSGKKTVQQSLTFTLELYPEWPYITNILAHITKYKYAIILHDKDKNDDGTFKKTHYHVVVQYGGYRTLSSVKNEYKTLQLEERFVDTCNKRAMLRYLIHKDNPEKYQYKQNEIITNMKDEVELALKDAVSSDTAFYKINKYINECTTSISQAELNQYCIDNGLLKGLRTYQGPINNARKEHNYRLDNTDNIISRAHENAIITGRKERESIFDTALVSGFDEVEIDGHRYQILRVQDKKK